MKKTILLSFLLGMMLLYPALVITGWICGFSVVLTLGNYGYLLTTVLFSAISLMLLQKSQRTRTTGILTTLLLLFSPVHAFVCFWESKSFWVFLLALVWVAFSGALMLRYGKYGFAQGLTTGVCLLLLLPIGFLSLFSLFPIGRNRVVQSLPSPGGTYCAQVIDSDQGALGGDTIVEVYESRKQVNLLLIKLQKNPQLVYLGNWGEFENMNLRWESEQVLLINGRSYEVE